jgi:hypothetical protein
MQRSYVQFVITDLNEHNHATTTDQAIRATPQVSMSRSNYDTETYLGFLKTGQHLSETDYRQQLNAPGFDLACFDSGIYNFDSFVRVSINDCPEAQ